MMLLLNLLLLGYIKSVLSGPSTPFGRRQTRHVVQYSWRVTPIVIAGDGYSRDAIGINDRPGHEFLIGTSTEIKSLFQSQMSKKDHGSK